MKKAYLLIAGIVITTLVGTGSYASAQYTSRNDSEDCIFYDASTLEIHDIGPRGWRLTSNGGSHWMLQLSSRSDAEAALALAKRHTAVCYIGRDNRRPNRRDYIVQYWK